MISVFGGTGFVGSEFCKQFKNEVEIIDRNSFKPTSEKVLYFISTVDNYNVLIDSHIDIDTNLTHLMKVLDECRRKDVEFTFISSWFVYGDTDLPAKEISICRPKGFYSITKYAAELLLESYCKTFNIKYNIIRLGNVLGNSDGKISKKKNALQFLISQIKEDKEINLYNNGNFYRDFIHVNDVAKGIKYIMDNGISNETYNLGCGIPVVFKSIIDYAVEKTNSRSNIGIMEATDFHKIVQVESMYLDTSKLNELGFKPEKNIYQIVDELLE